MGEYFKDQEYIDAFLSDVNDSLEILDWSVLELEREPENKEIINKAFRAAHNLKGMTAMMELNNLSNFTHKIEDMLHQIREDKLKVDENIIDILLVSNEMLEKSVTSVLEKGDDKELRFEKVINSIKAIIEQSKGSPVEVIKSVEIPEIVKDKIIQNINNNYNIYKIIFGVDQESMFKKVRAFMVIKELNETGEILYSTPPEELLKDEEFALKDPVEILFASKESKDSIFSLVINVQEIDFAEVDHMSKTMLSKDYSVNFENIVDIIIEDPHCEINENHLEFANEIDIILDEIELNVLEIETQNENINLIYKMYRGFHSIKGFSGLLCDIFTRELSEAAEKYLELMRKRGELLGEDADVIVKVTGMIRKLVTNITSDNLLNIQEESRDLLTEVKTKIKLLEALILESGGIVIPQKIGEIFTEVTNLSKEEVEELVMKQKASYPNLKLGEVALKEKKLGAEDILNTIRIQTNQKKKETAISDNFVKVNIKQIDDLANMIGEIMILESQIEEEVRKISQNSSVIGNVLRMTSLTKDVQNLAMSMSMVSLKSTFQRVYRVARDTMNQLGKNVNINLQGEDTRVDRSVAEKILDPLLHMAKNSISHGIEMPTERSKQGKNEEGNLIINAFNQKGNVYVQISDDGRGLDPEKLYKKALEKGIIDPAKKYSDDEKINFIFLPGFSTAEAVNNVSGRGVGMDVVKTELTRIGGKLSIDNDPGQGLTFTLKIPINLAAINGTIIEVTGDKYIIPTVNIKEISSTDKGKWINSFGKKSMFKLRDKIYPAIFANEIFEKDDEEEHPVVLLLEFEKEYKVFPIKRIIDKREVVVKALSDEFADLDFLAGASILGDGKVSLILDVERLFHMRS